GRTDRRPSARRRGAPRDPAVLRGAGATCRRQAQGLLLADVREARVKPAPFDYVRPGGIGEVHDLLAAEGPGGRILAGGQTLMPMLSMRLARPKTLIDITHIQELARLGVERDFIRVGAAVRQAQLMGMFELANVQPLLAQVLPWVGHAQTRSRGT